MTRLSRRALLALPVVLPAAAGAAKMPEPRYIDLDFGSASDATAIAVGRVEVSFRRESSLPFTLEPKWARGGDGWESLGDGYIRLLPAPRMSDSDLARTLGIGESNQPPEGEGEG